MKPVAIIGGGITGLTAAFRLKQHGVPVVLLEASNRLGGAIGSVRRAGYLAESGPNSILETSPAVSDLVRDLGLESRRVYPDVRAEKRFVVRRGKLVPVPASLAKFFSTPLFSPGAKLRLLCEPFIPPAAPELEESVGDFVRRRLGQEFLDYAVDPLAAGIYAGNPDLLSVAQAFPKFHAVEQRYGSLLLGQFLGARERKRRGEISKRDARPFSFDEGLQVLIDALQARVSPAIETGVPVHGLRRDGEGWIVELDLGPGRELECSAVILALPSHKIAALDIRPAAVNFSALDQIYYPPVASIVVGFRRDDVEHPLDGFGFLAPQKENLKILGALFSSSLFPHRAPAGEVAITVYMGGARQPILPLESPGLLTAMAVHNLQRILHIYGRPKFQHFTLHHKAIPQYNIGYGRFRDLMTDMERAEPGLFIAGHARDGISVADSIVSGCRVAGRIETFLQKTSSQNSPHRLAA